MNNLYKDMSHTYKNIDIAFDNMFDVIKVSTLALATPEFCTKPLVMNHYKWINQ